MRNDMKKLSTLLVLAMFILMNTTFAQYNDPRGYDVINASGTITLDGNLNEPAWNLVPNALVFGPGAPTNTTNYSVTGGVMVKLDTLKGYDTTHTVVKIIKQGMNLYIGFQSTDKQVCKFGDSWEGDGLFMKIKNASGADKEFKLYFNASGANPNIVYEATDPSHGAGAAVKGSNTVVNDTTQVDNGYSAELLIKLDMLGFTPNTKRVSVMLNIFDPDYYHAGMSAWGPKGTFHKTWWGSEWGPAMRTLNFLDDPQSLTVLNATTPITVDGNLNEIDWTRNYDHLVFGPFAPGNNYAKTVTGGVCVKGPNFKDTTWTYLRIIKSGMKLYIGFQSNDKSVCKFGDSWEGDGLFMKIKNAANQDKEFKLYFNASGANPNVVYEATNPSHGMGAAVKNPGTVVNDTTQVDNGYQAELVIYLDSLGFTPATTSVQVMLNIFDPDGYHTGMGAWGALGEYHKTWWGSEWGSSFRTLNLSNLPTPVELTSFTASVINDNVLLQWVTATEINNKGFEVQRSINNSNFVTIGFVNGAGTSSETHSYQFVDAKVQAGSKYQYRLRQIDLDGSESFSKVIEVGEIAPVEFELAQNYPNPFNPSTQINFALPVKSNVVISLYNSLGQEITKLASGEFEAGTHTLNLDASTLSSGVYVYTLSAQGTDGRQFFSAKKMNLMK